MADLTLKQMFTKLGSGDSVKKKGWTQDSYMYVRTSNGVQSLRMNNGDRALLDDLLISGAQFEEYLVPKYKWLFLKNADVNPTLTSTYYINFSDAVGVDYLNTDTVHWFEKIDNLVDPTTI